MNKNTICLTGAYGFVGRALCTTLIKSNRSIRALVRKIDLKRNIPEVNYFETQVINLNQKLEDIFIDCDCIIHCVGKAHNMNNDNLDNYLIDNIEFTKQFTEIAIKTGVRRIIFLSTIKVNGENTNNNDKIKVFNHIDRPNPQDSYGISKLKAKKVLWDISLKIGLEVVILRLPLVYGSGVKGNLKRLMKLINFRVPLPFKGIRNKRSLIGIDNLIDLIIRCIEHPNVAGKTFLVCDGEDLSTPDLLRHVASSMERSTRLFPFPISLLKLFGFAIGKSSEINRLTNSLQVDISFTRKTLNWSPPLTVQEGIRCELLIYNKEVLIKISMVIIHFKT